MFALCSLLLTQVFVFLCWIPFRAKTGADTLVVWRKLLDLATTVWEASQPIPWLLLLLPLLADTWLVGSKDFTARFRMSSPVAFYCAFGAAVLVGLLFMHVGFTPFIYFQF